MIAFQDFKERQVWAFLFPAFALLGGLLFYQNSFPTFFWISILINLGIVISIIIVNFLVAKFILKKNLLKEVLGLGDLLFFVGFAVSFPTLTFINFFFFSILFTVLLYWVVKKTNSLKHKTIPLAGSMALFLLAVYLTHWLGFYNSIYVL